MGPGASAEFLSVLVTCQKVALGEEGASLVTFCSGFSHRAPSLVSHGLDPFHQICFPRAEVR